MREKVRRGVFGVLLLVFAGWSAVMLIPWSQPCDTQQRGAEDAWRHYADVCPKEHRLQALTIAGEVAAHLDEAVRRADSLAPPESGRAAYRDAMERLALAESACAP